jgi:hypothetical protein
MRHTGPSEEIRRLRVDLDWLADQGATIRRVDPQHDGLSAYMDNPAVRELLKSEVPALPVVLVNGESAVVGRYPSREELAALAGLAPTDQRAHQGEGIGADKTR